MGGYRGRQQHVFDQCYKALYDLLGQQKIRPFVDETLGFEQLPTGLKRLFDRQSKGRIMFDPGI